jgi:hypothetical protein
VGDDALDGVVGGDWCRECWITDLEDEGADGVGVGGGEGSAWGRAGPWERVCGRAYVLVG